MLTMQDPLAVARREYKIADEAEQLEIARRKRKRRLEILQAQANDLEMELADKRRLIGDLAQANG